MHRRRHIAAAHPPSNIINLLIPQQASGFNEQLLQLLQGASCSRVFDVVLDRCLLGRTMLRLASAGIHMLL